MAGPIEILIVVGAFGIIGTYLYIVHRFIASGEESSTAHDPKKEPADQNPTTSHLRVATF